MKLFAKNLGSLFCAMVLSVVLSLYLNRFTPLHSPHWYFGLVFLTVLGATLNFVYASKAGSPDFTQLLIVALVIKLLLALAWIIVSSFFTDKPGFFNISVQFILHFILFTAFEIGYLRHIIKTHPLKK